jgi:hypothetical protein
VASLIRGLLRRDRERRVQLTQAEVERRGRVGTRPGVMSARPDATGVRLACARVKRDFNDRFDFVRAPGALLTATRAMSSVSAVSASSLVPRIVFEVRRRAPSTGGNSASIRHVPARSSRTPPRRRPPFGLRKAQPRR